MELRESDLCSKTTNEHRVIHKWLKKQRDVGLSTGEILYIAFRLLKEGLSLF